MSPEWDMEMCDDSEPISPPVASVTRQTQAETSIYIERDSALINSDAHGIDKTLFIVRFNDIKFFQVISEIVNSQRSDVFYIEVCGDGIRFHTHGGIGLAGLRVDFKRENLEVFAFNTRLAKHMHSESGPWTVLRVEAKPIADTLKTKSESYNLICDQIEGSNQYVLHINSVGGSIKHVSRPTDATDTFHTFGIPVEIMTYVGNGNNQALRGHIKNSKKTRITIYDGAASGFRFHDGSEERGHSDHRSSWIYDEKEATEYQFDELICKIILKLIPFSTYKIYRHINEDGKTHFITISTATPYCIFYLTLRMILGTIATPGLPTIQDLKCEIGN